MDKLTEGGLVSLVRLLKNGRRFFFVNGFHSLNNIKYINTHAFVYFSLTVKFILKLYQES